MRRLRKQQDRCQMTLGEKFSNYGVKSHGFASSRTVSCRFCDLGVSLCSLRQKHHRNEKVAEIRSGPQRFSGGR